MKYRALQAPTRPPANRRTIPLRTICTGALLAAVTVVFAPTPTPAAEAGADRSELLGQRSELEAAIAQAPEDPALKIRLAKVLANLGDDEPARTAAQEALAALRAADDAATPMAADAHHLTADIDRRAGRLAEAIRGYQATLAADNERLPALIGLAGSLAEAGFHRESIPAFGIWVQEQPDEPAARLGAATAMIYAREHARAKQVLDEALEAMPENLDILDLLARHLAACPDREVRDGQRAITLALRLTREVPTPQSHETLAMAYAEAGQREAAVEVQGKLLEELSGEADRTTLARWRANLQRYRSGLACCA